MTEDKKPQTIAECLDERFGQPGSGFVTKDSGEREEWVTGSKRDARDGKGRYDLIPVGPLRRLAGLYERGAVKYDDRNWEKGQPLSRYCDSAMRHLLSVLDGEEDEDHAAAVVWNMFALMYTLEKIRSGKLPEELCDLPYKVSEVGTHG